MNIRFASHLVTILSLLLSPVAAEEEIVIRLPTEAKRLPLYVAPFDSQVRDVLVMDLLRSGRCRITEKPAGESWRDAGILYRVECRREGDRLHATLISTSTGRERHFEVEGSRTGAHRLSDAIHQELFGLEGIASHGLLYTVKVDRPGAEPLAEVWMCDSDGKGARRVTHTGNLCITPCVLPPTDGRSAGSFFYVGYETGQSKVYGASLRDGAGRRLLSLRGNQLAPAVSPRRDRIAFVSDAGGNPDLFVQGFSPESGPIGKPMQLFSARRAAQGSPTWSPDGSQIAFVSNKDGAPRIYLIDVPEGAVMEKPTPRLLTKLHRENTSPAWSPDGNKIAYCAKVEGTRQIWIYDVATGREEQLTTGPGHKENPAWAPDSDHLAFNSADREQCELYITSLEGRKAVRLTSGAGEKRFPAWLPR